MENGGGREEAPGAGARGALLVAPGLTAGLPGIAVAMRSGGGGVGSDCPVEPPLSLVEDPYFFWGVLSFCMPRILSSRSEMKASVGL